MATLEAQGLRKQYRRRLVVDDVSLRIGSGEVVGLLGPGGAGKTTSFYMIVGLIKADAGLVWVNNKDVTGLSMHQRARLGIGYLPQEASAFRKLSVYDNVAAIVETRPGLNRQQRQERTESLLASLRIEARRDQSTLSLSGGERRRVEVARALAAEPQFILLDEPFAGVDPISIGDIQRLIGDLRERQIGVLITDHNVQETLRICDRAYILSDGRLLAEGAPRDIVKNDAVRERYLGQHFSFSGN